MIVCSCRGVPDRVVRRVIAEGARNIDEIATMCGAGGRCQGCWPALRQLLDEAGGAGKLVGSSKHNGSGSDGGGHS